MFIQTEVTPNPETLKFIPGCTVLSGRILDLPTRQDAQISPLAQALFEIEGVEGVLLGEDFLAVSKRGGDWSHLKPAILGVIMEHFLSGAPLLRSKEEDMAAKEEEFFDPSQVEIVAHIKTLLEERVRPAVLSDGGDIVFKGFRDGIVYLHMRGACAGCPSSTATLKYSVQNLLCHFIPEVKGVEQI